MTEEQTPSLRVARSCVFSPVSPHFRRRWAPLKVSLWRRMSADATGIFILAGTTTGNRLRLTRFLPVNPSFGRTGDNALLLTAFAFAFSPVSPLSVAAFAALKVSFPGACPGKDEFLF